LRRTECTGLHHHHPPQQLQISSVYFQHCFLSLPLSPEPEPRSFQQKFNPSPNALALSWELEM
jgi:hypothetical protein